jgi:hypothetical protein
MDGIQLEFGRLEPLGVGTVEAALVFGKRGRDSVVRDLRLFIHRVTTRG